MHVPRAAELALGEQGEDPAGRHVGVHVLLDFHHAALVQLEVAVLGPLEEDWEWPRRPGGVS